jgi:hypothetical protein
MRSQTGDLSRGLDTVHDRHLKVQDHDVRMQFFYFLYRDPAVLGLAAYSPFAAALEANGADAGSLRHRQSRWNRAIGLPGPWLAADREAASYRSTDGDEERVVFTLAHGAIAQYTDHCTLPHIRMPDGELRSNRADFCWQVAPRE